MENDVCAKEAVAVEMINIDYCNVNHRMIIAFVVECNC